MKLYSNSFHNLYKFHDLYINSDNKNNIYIIINIYIYIYMLFYEKYIVIHLTIYTYMHNAANYLHNVLCIRVNNVKLITIDYPLIFFNSFLLFTQVLHLLTTDDNDTLPVTLEGGTMSCVRLRYNLSD